MALWCSIVVGARSAAASDVVPPVALSTPAPSLRGGPATPHRVWLELTIDAQGNVSAAHLEGSELSLDEQRVVVDTALRWRFVPASVDGVARASRIRILVEVRQSPAVVESAPGATADEPAEPAVGASSLAAPPRHEHDVPVVSILVQGRARPLTSGALRRDRRLLEATPHRSGSELLETLPGMFLTQHGGEGKAHQIFYRGFDAVHGQDLEVQVGGVPINEVSNIHGQGYLDLHFVVPELVESLEIQPGPFSVRQGDFAIAGSARYRLGAPVTGLTTKAGFGSFGRRRVFVSYRPDGRPASDFVAVEVLDADGPGERRGVRRVSSWSQVTGWIDERTSFRALLGYHAGAFESPGVLRLDQVDAGQVGRFSSYDLGQGGHSARALYAGDVVWHGDSQRTRLTPFVMARSLDLSYNYTGALQHSSTDHTTQRHQATTLGASVVHERRMPLLSSRDELELGVSMRHDGIAQSQVMGGEGQRLADADISVQQLGAFAGAELHGIPRTVVRTGLRADALWFTTNDRLVQVVREASGTHLGPKLAIDVALASSWHVQLAAARGFRSPQARSLGDGESTPFTRVSAAELGTQLELSRSLSASVAAYASWLEDDLVFDETTSRNEAAPSSRRGGLSVDVTATTRELVSSCGGSAMSSVFTTSDGRFERGQQVPYVPRLVARCDLGLRHQLALLGGRPVHVGAGVSEQLVWQRPLPYGETDPGFVLTDLSLWLRFASFELRLDIENAFDATWNDSVFVYPSRFEQAPASALPRRHVTTGAPRTAMFTASMYGWR